MPFDNLRARINREPRSIKPELFYEISAQVAEIMSPFNEINIHDELAMDVRELARSMGYEVPKTYIQLTNLITLPRGFGDIATGSNHEASRLHFTQHVNIYDGVVNRCGVELTDEQALRLTIFLNRADIYVG